MTPRAVRFVVLGIGVIGIAGMIVGSIRDSNGMAVTFGLLIAISIGFLIMLTAVVGPEAFHRTDGAAPAEPGRPDEHLAQDVEDRIGALVESGADETELRRLVTRAIELGRSAR